ncbi:hypothetical protein J6590_011905 [Homalodisca vitripennis]|nr:hypothetical protein J6590_011905 [Homalodisca vitripennis]
MPALMTRTLSSPLRFLGAVEGSDIIGLTTPSWARRRGRRSTLEHTGIIKEKIAEVKSAADSVGEN